jgi:hypothetical protein
MGRQNLTHHERRRTGAKGRPVEVAVASEG